jgi:hypothetical protein
MMCPDYNRNAPRPGDCQDSASANTIDPADRPTLFHTRAPGTVCSLCAANNAPGWTRCFMCGALSTSALRTRRRMAASLAAVAAALGAVAGWRLAAPPPMPRCPALNMPAFGACDSTLYVTIPDQYCVVQIDERNSTENASVIYTRATIAR